MSESVLDRVVEILRKTKAHDSSVVKAPIALLWPDGDTQWQSIIPMLRDRCRIVSFGSFDPERGQGPAYWLRCVVARTVELDGAPTGVPIIYLPGISRDELRAIESVTPELRPLCALQHRCQWISHPNGKDWTVRAMFSNVERGFGLSVATDSDTAAALVASLPELVLQPWRRLEAKHIDVDFLNGLLNPDPIRSMLDWLDDPISMQSSLSDAGWNAFVQQCKSDLGFDPATQGEIEGARRLGHGEGQWAQAWQRFRENPTEFPGIPDRLRQAQPSELLPIKPGSWPGHASEEEDRLRDALSRLSHATPQEARARVLELEKSHGVRRDYVWSDLGWTPLALALEHLAELARLTSAGPGGAIVEAIAEWYSSAGWRADMAVLAALKEVVRQIDVAAVETAVAAVYKPWADACARSFQMAVGPMANAETYVAAPPAAPRAGDVVLFVDGLRLDVAHLLNDRLAFAGYHTDLSAVLAALPTITQTSKPALVPIDQGLLTAGSGLDARRAPDGPTARVQVLRGLMADAGIQLLGASEAGEAGGIAWSEAGEIDRRGHELGLRLVHEIDGEVQRIATRIEDLLAAGWSRVMVVTDHGWLLVPGGLPKNEDLPVAVAVTKKGRCARVKHGAATLVPTVPWHWDCDVRIAVAPGISCFEANQAYEHGGVSPQECVVPRLIVSSGERHTAGVAVTSMKWRGLSLVVEFSGLPDGATIDLRVTAGDAESSVAHGRMAGEGKMSLLVGDEDLEGEQAHLVLVGADGSLLVQRETTVGQNR